MSNVPTHWPVTYKCGHKEKRDLSKVPPSKRAAAAASDFFATKAGKDKNGMVCTKCFNKEHKQFLRQIMLDTEQFETDHQLPELTGTDKQVSAGLVESARRDRCTVLADVVENTDDSAAVLDAARSLTWAGWWVNTLGYKLRTKFEYGTDEYVELITDGAEQEAKREDHHIESENPHDWKG